MKRSKVISLKTLFESTKSTNNSFIFFMATFFLVDLSIASITLP